MKDRIPANPGRVLITPENGEAFYAKMERADNPIEKGDALNKKNLLPDEVAGSLGLEIAANPVPADAFAHIAAKGLRIGITVHGGTSAPSSPKDGDIWVNTSTSVSGWAYAFTEPDNPTEGKVWLQASEGVALDTFVDGNITISPISARQFVGGLWVSKEAKTYVNGEWKDWITLLINGADECADVTGGWDSLAVNIYDGTSARALNVTTGDSYIELTGGGGGQGGIFVTNNKILCNGSTSLRISGEIAAYADRVKIAAMSSRSSDGVAAEWIVPGGSAGAEPKTYTDEAVLDLPAGEYYIAFSIYSTDFQYIKLNRVYLADKAGGAILPGGGTGSGEISAGAIAQAIESYLEANPIEGLTPTVQDYGAKGDGTTDDTAAFQTALAENRVVLVPGGTYKLSGELGIGHHCELELSADTVLNFTQTTGNCITLGMFSSLKGNHAVVNVPYGFTGNAICADSANHESSEIYEVQPWKKWDPQWKYARYVTDLCICKKDSRGFHYSVNGECNGTAVYIAAGSGSQMWGLHYSGLLIAGAFTYGVHGVCKDGAWVHEMRIGAFIDGCEIGVCLEKCNQTYISAVIQPRCNYTTGEVYGVYAKQGIKLVDCINTDLSGSRVWDWYNGRTACDESIEYRSIAMYGSCRGTIINDFVCYWSNTNFKDTRDAIYTDTPSNLETLTILQEPITRWFKPKEGKPYFRYGDTEYQLALMSDMDYVDQYFNTAGMVAAYTDVKSPYQKDVAANDSSGAIISRTGNLYIEPKAFSVGDVVRIRGLDFTSNYPGLARAYLFYKDSGAYKSLVNFASLIAASPTGSFYNNEATYEWDAETKTLTVTFVGSYAATMTSTYKYAFGAGFASGYTVSDVIMTVNEEIKYTQVGLLADSIKVKSENIIGNAVLTSPNGTRFVLAVSDSGTLSATAVN